MSPVVDRPEATRVHAAGIHRIVLRRATPLFAVAVLFALLALAAPRAPLAAGAAPFRLADTGLYRDFATREIDPANAPFTPQYPLWTDGAAKRRFIHLPPGTSIDASNPDAWAFPVGTTLWKEFAFDRPVETRYMERLPDGSWLYATYAWTDDGSDAVLAPERGIPAAAEIREGVRHDIPATADCRACHQGQPNEVLGFSLLQLSPDRDPLAPHATAAAPGSIDLAELARRGLVTGLPRALLEHPPRILAADPVARAAMGYLHGNCASCHNARGPLAGLGMSFEHTAQISRAEDEPARRTTLARPSGFRHPADGGRASERVRPGDPAHSVVLYRLGSRNPVAQMPPMGTQSL